jgi:hypothetical protein
MNIETVSPISKRIAGGILAFGSILSVLAMAHHPSTASHDMIDVAAEIASKARASQIVHGLLIAVLVASVFAFLDLCGTLDFRRPTVRAGFVAYAAGSGAMIGATLISGFLIPTLVARYEGEAAAALEALGHSLRLASVANRTLASFSVVAMSVAIFLVSSALLRGRRRSMVPGVLGMFVGVVPPAALLFGGLRLEVHGMSLVVALQCVWNVAVGVQLYRWGRSEARRSTSELKEDDALGAR